MAEANNSINQNNMLVKIRSKYIVIKIFENLKENRLLKLIHYNKKYQKLMDKKIIDYKIIFSKIEIEIIPKENTYDKFINISNKNIQSNYLIYFNDNKEEIKRKYITKEDCVTKIKIIINHKITSLSGLFSDCKCIKIINFTKFNKDNINNMSYMFFDCLSLEALNLSNFNTNKVTNMRSIFSGCSSLKELNLSNFNTNNVTDMSWMFSDCSSLQVLNLSNFSANNATDLNEMFNNCSSLISLICENELIKKRFKNIFI